ncbi:hypothetical protein [Actinomyces bowdenii]|uniref:Uncharacterized protein n=1 Tax=Actinomyces bowdenii TaxID=131109 RepID=A0A853EI71_9ACTO|nr:hypothetical protein [Actinomyces bowdenii]MBF0696097.1 hypothetical protein [Actinomyces bowdenii]NYS68270.1 hypothetical protein [Actinomyces bowdenii]
MGAREIRVGAVLTPRPQLPRVRIEGLAEAPLVLTTGEAVSLARLLELSAAEADASYEVMTDPDWQG